MRQTLALKTVNIKHRRLKTVNIKHYAGGLFIFKRTTIFLLRVRETLTFGDSVRE
jgi:hypothetical protein